MKTNLEWLQEMDEPERSQAIENAKMYGVLDVAVWNSITTALKGSFSFSESPEGLYYWILICKKYAYGTGS